MESKKDILVSFPLLDDGFSLVRFKEFIEKVNVIWEKIPDEHKNNAWLDLSVEEDYNGHKIKANVEYSREETDVEYKKRLKEIRRKEKMDEEKEKALFLKLKKKWGEKT